MVDGYCWPIYTIRPWGWQEVTKYVVGPGFYKVCHPILVNLDMWNKIPEDQQKVLVEVLMEEEHAAAARDLVKVENERGLLEKAGLEFIEFSPDETKKYYDLAYSSGWEGQIKVSPVYGPRLRKILTK